MDNNIHYTINNTKFSWDVTEGSVTFDGAHIVLFWIESAFKTLLDAIEEVSGFDSAQVVLETSGYRMGQIVASHYVEIGDLPAIMRQLPNTYMTAGWGRIEFPLFDGQEKHAVVRMRNSWEYKVNVAQQKSEVGRFLPGHWAGVFSGLFRHPMWYRITKSQLQGDDYDEIEIFAAPISPDQNIHDLIRRKEKQRIFDLEQMVDARTQELNEMVQELSVPVIPVLEGVIVIPLMGKFNAARSQELMYKALNGLKEYKAEFLLLDLTGLKQVDEDTLHLLHKLIDATALLGGKCVLVGVSPAVSTKIVDSGHNMSGILSFSTLQHGIYFALAQMDMKILKKK